MDPRKLYCVIGQPLGHSLSPLLHNAAFRERGWPGVYLALPQTMESLPDFFRAVRTLPISGCNITLPFKVASMEHVDELSGRALKVGAINTVWWREGRLAGENTDVLGFAAPLRGRSFERALVLGAGGVTRAAVVALRELGVPSVVLSNRTASRAEALAAELGADFVPWEERERVEADLVVNATSLGMRGKTEGETAYGAFEGRSGLAYDIVYTPEETLFLRKAGEAGWERQSGVAMFVEQARAAFALWTGLEMPKESSFALVREALAGRA